MRSHEYVVAPLGAAPRSRNGISIVAPEGADDGLPASVPRHECLGYSKEAARTRTRFANLYNKTTSNGEVEPLIRVRHLLSRRKAFLRWPLFTAIACLFAAYSSSAAEIDFDQDIAPILSRACYRCHGAHKQRSNFRLDQRVAALEGGDLGKAIIPGKPDDSPLLKYVSDPQADLVMSRK